MDVQCEYCGRALKPDDWQCPGCGAPVEKYKETEQTERQEETQSKNYTETQNTTENGYKESTQCNVSEIGALLRRSDYGGFTRRCVAEWMDYLFLALVLLLTESGEIYALVYCAYQILGASWVFRGATFGKRLMKIKVVNSRYEMLTLGQSVGRLICKFLSMATIFFGFVMIIFTKKRQSLHDRLCETYVIRVRN